MISRTGNGINELSSNFNWDHLCLFCTYAFSKKHESNNSSSTAMGKIDQIGFSNRSCQICLGKCQLKKQKWNLYLYATMNKNIKKIMWDL